MDVKILPWENDTQNYVINENQILMISKIIKNNDDNQMLPFKRVDINFYNIDTRVIETILPNLTKYQAATIHYAAKENKKIYFVHLEYASFPMGTFILFCYDMEKNVCREIYRFEDNLKNYKDDKDLQIFILTNQYLLFQIRKSGPSGNSYMSFLYDRKNKLTYDILDERLTRYGIQQFIPVAQNVVAIRYGRNQLKNNKLSAMDRNDCDKETICLVSISQFIADVLLKIKIISSEVIDEVYIDKTFSEIKKLGKFIVFSRIDRETGYQEIFYYQYINKNTSMLLNNNHYNPKKIFPCVMNGVPLVVRLHKKKYEFYQIKDNKLIFKISADDDILYCNDDYLITSRPNNGLFKKSKKDTVEIYQFSTLKKIYKEKIRPIDFLNINKETLAILVEDSND